MRNSEFLKYAKEIDRAFPTPLKIVIPRNYEWDVSGDSWQFIEDNIEWLIKWFDSPREMNEPEIRIPVTTNKRLYPIDKEPIIEIKTLKMQRFESSFDRLGLMVNNVNPQFEHVKFILYSAVYGVQSLGVIDNGEFLDTLIRTMGGFVEQTGRLPTPEDRCRFIYLGDNGTKRWFTSHKLIDSDAPIVVVSECCLQVL